MFEALHADSLCGFDEFIEPDTSVNPEPLRVTDASKYFYHFADQPISLLNLRQFHFGKINPAAPRVLETFSLPRIPGSEFHPFVLVVLPTRERAVGRLKKESPQSGVMLGWVKPHTPSGGSVWFSAAEKIMPDFSISH